MKIKPHLQYARYVIRHKYFVMQEGIKLGVSLYQLIIHDWHKMTPGEWFPYVETFYGEKPSPRRKDGGYDPNAVSDAFDLAWLRHQKRGKHHWQYWCLPKDDGTLKVLAMPDKYRREMLADWRGAGRAISGSDDCLGWYDVNRDKMCLHSETRAWIERQLGWLPWMDGRPHCTNLHKVCNNDSDGDGDCSGCVRWRKLHVGVMPTWFSLNDEVEK